MLNNDERSKLYEINRAIENATFDLRQQRQDEHDKLQKTVIERTVKEVLEAIGKDHFEAIITFAIRDALQESRNLSDYLR